MVWIKVVTRSISKLEKSIASVPVFKECTLRAEGRPRLRARRLSMARMAVFLESSTDMMLSE